MMGQFLDGTQN